MVVNIDFWFGMSFHVFSCELVSEVFSSVSGRRAQERYFETSFVASEVVKSNVLAF